jgi:hypothetical protein
VIRYDLRSIRYDKIPTECFSRKYHLDIDFEINKYVCITYVNGHNSRLSVNDCLYMKYQFHLDFHTESQFCTGSIKNFWFYSTKLSV